MTEKLKEEFSALLSDVREQILYLQELGLASLEADLPEIQSSKLAAQDAKREVRTQKLERFVSTDLPLPNIQKNESKIADAPGSSARQSILEKSKLSRFSPSKGNDKTQNFLINQTQEQTKSDTMPKKSFSPDVAQETPQDSLFGDILQTLPEVNETIEDIRLDIGNCIRCPLWEGRTKIVHSEGNLQADLVFVGEAPGANEDAEGRPFVGRAGQLLNKIIEAIGLKREDVFIGNVNRCRPPGNRQPTMQEANTCKPFLLREITVLRPKVIVVLGNTATQNLLNTKVGITKLRGEFQDYFGVKVMPTFHPAYLLRDPTKKRETWDDMKKVRDYLNQQK